VLFAGDDFRSAVSKKTNHRGRREEERAQKVKLVRLNQISGEVVDAAIAVHSALGPGLLESAYEACLVYELRKRGLKVEAQVPLPVIYESVHLELGYRIDLLVENVIVLELKACESIAPVHRVQLLSYLRLSGSPLGLLLNFHVALMKDGIVRMRNGF
jgi:GxxExxY protein